MGMRGLSLFFSERRIGADFSHSSSGVKSKQVNMPDFSTAGNEATVCCGHFSVTLIPVLVNSSPKEASPTGKGWDGCLAVGREMRLSRAARQWEFRGKKTSLCGDTGGYTCNLLEGEEGRRTSVPGHSGGLEGGSHTWNCSQPLHPWFPSF